MKMSIQPYTFDSLFSKFSKNSESFASEYLEHFEEMHLSSACILTDSNTNVYLCREG